MQIIQDDQDDGGDDKRGGRWALPRQQRRQGELEQQHPGPRRPQWRQLRQQLEPGETIAASNFGRNRHRNNFNDNKKKSNPRQNNFFSLFLSFSLVETTNNDTKIPIDRQWNWRWNF